MEEICKSVLL